MEKPFFLKCKLNKNNILRENKLNETLTTLGITYATNTVLCS